MGDDHRGAVRRPDVLGDYGADVVKIEPPGRPDPLRDWGQGAYRGHHFMWTVIGRNKRCITLDPRTGRGRELFLQLVERTDVIVENFRPGTLERWDLAYDVLSGVNPGSSSGAGLGLRADRAVRLEAGLRLGGRGHERPAWDQRLPRPAAAAHGGVPRRLPRRHGRGPGRARGALLPLGHGKGQVVDIAITEACLSVLESAIPEYDKLGRVRGPGGTRLDGIAPSNIYQSSDGLWMVVAANQDTVYRRLCDAMGRPELATDERFVDHVARGRNQDEIDGIVAEWVAARPAAEVRRILDEAGVIVGPINTVAEVVTDEQFLARDMIVPHPDERLGEDVLGPGVVPTFAGTPARVRRAGPALGADNHEVYAELGLSAAEIDELTTAGTI